MCLEQNSANSDFVPNKNMEMVSIGWRFTMRTRVKTVSFLDSFITRDDGLTVETMTFLSYYSLSLLLFFPNLMYAL